MSRKSEKNAPVSSPKDHTPVLIKPIYAAVDIGSNNIRVVLFGLNQEGHVVEAPLDIKTKFPSALAEGMSSAKTAVIQEPNLHDAEQALETISKLITKHNIPHNNIEAVATAALRAVEGTENGDKAIRRLRKAFHPYSFEIISKDEEALLVYETAQLDPLYQLAMVHLSSIHAKKDTSPCVAILATGGGSTEACVASPHEGALEMHTIFQGMWRLKETQLQTGSTHASGVKFISALEEKNIFQSKAVRARGLAALFTIGGAYRAVGKAVCGDKTYFLIGIDTIQQKLIDATNRSETYYQNHPDDSVKERYSFIAVAAEILARAVQYTGVNNVIFLRKKMTDAMAQRIHKRAQNQNELKAGLPQPSSPSVQGQPVPA